MSSGSIERLRGAVCHALNGEAILFPGAGAPLSASGILASSDSATSPATNEGLVRIDVRDSTIMTAGPRAKGIAGAHTHTGGVDIDVSNTSITRKLYDYQS